MIAAQVLEDDQDRFAIGTVPDPEPGPGDVLVRVEAAGLAPGAFNLLRAGRVPILPTIFGHEVAGVAVAVGAGADPAWVGRRVRMHPLLGCGRCEYCVSDREMMCSAHSMIGHTVFGPDAMPLYRRYHDGGLAELVVVPQTHLDDLPDAVSFDLGAKVHDVANAVRALKLAALPPAATLVVTAATGTMGTATACLAPEFGVARVIVTGRSEERLEAVRALDPERIATVVIADTDTAGSVVGRVRAIAPQGAHAVIDYYPEGDGLAKLFGALRLGGRIVTMGMLPRPLSIPLIALSVSCTTVVGTRGCTRADALDALRVMARDPDRYARLITHRFPLIEANAARALLTDRSEPLWMAVVNPRAA